MRKLSCYTLVELLITVAILGMLVSLLQPSLKKMVSISQSNQCQFNLKNIQTGLALYLQDQDSQLPGPSWASQLSRFKNKWGTLQQNTARYLSDYLTSSVDSSGSSFLPDYLCPSNRDIDLNLSLEARTHYRVSQLNKYPFGYPVNADNPVAKIPKRLHEIPELHKNWSFTDVDRINATWFSAGDAPELPIHTNVSRNYLYFDGHVSNELYE